MSDRRGGGGAGRAPFPVLAFGLTSAFALATPAFAEQPELPAFGMVRLTQGQTATVHLVLTHVPYRAHPGCHVTASFVDAKGQTLEDSAGKPYSKTIVLEENVAAELSLPVDEILPVGEERMLVRAALRETPAPGTWSNCCALTPILEVGNANGSVSDEILPRGPNPPSPFCVTIGGEAR